jgi:hypothetical protein
MDEVKYNEYTFWYLHRDKHHQTVAETLAYVNEHMPLTLTLALGGSQIPKRNSYLQISSKLRERMGRTG